MSTRRIILAVLVLLTVVALMDIADNGFRFFLDLASDEGIAREVTRDKVTELIIPRVSKEEEVHRDFPGVRELHLLNRFGKVTITPADDNQLHVSCEMIVEATNEKAAQQILDEMELETRANGDVVFVQVKLRGQSLPQIKTTREIRKIQVDYTIRAPKSWDITATNGFGPLEIRDFNGNIDATNQHDALWVRNIQGNVRVENSFDPTHVTGVTGRLEVNTQHGSVLVTDIDGPATVRCSFDSADIRNVSGPLEVFNRHADVYIVSPGDKVTARAEHGNLTIEGLRAAADLEARHGDLRIYLEDTPAGYTIDARSEHASIRSSQDLDIEELDPNTNLARGQIGDGQNELRIRTEFGSIDIH